MVISITASRLRGFSQKINKVLIDQHSSVVFLKNPAVSSDGDYHDSLLNFSGS